MKYEDFKHSETKEVLAAMVEQCMSHLKISFSNSPFLVDSESKLMQWIIAMELVRRVYVSMFNDLWTIRDLLFEVCCRIEQWFRKTEQRHFFVFVID